MPILNISFIEKKYDPQMGDIIQSAMKDFGYTDNEINTQKDPYLHCLSKYYAKHQGKYWVIIDDNYKVYGGCGFIPIDENQKPLRKKCEIQKFYLLPEIQGQGWGRKLLEHVLKTAYNSGYRDAFLTTSYRMQRAVALYEKFGFTTIDLDIDQEIIENLELCGWHCDLSTWHSKNIKTKSLIPSFWNTNVFDEPQSTKSNCKII